MLWQRLITGPLLIALILGVVWFDATTHTLYASINDDAKAEIAITLTGVDAITAADLVL